MATITYTIGKPKMDGTRKIYFILSHKGQRKRIPSNIDVEAKDFSRSGRISSRRVQKLVDDKLRELKDRLYDLEVDLMDNRVDVEWIYSRLDKKEVELDFFEFADKWLEKCKLKGYKNYISMLNSLVSFCGTRSLPFQDIDYTFLNRYKDFLDGHPRAQSLYLGNMRHLFNEAIKEYNNEYDKPLPSSPFEKFSVPKDVPRTKDRVVTVENLVKIFKYEGKGRPAMARDCYVMSFCLMGMNSVDLYNCTRYEDGILKYERTKTRDRRSDNAYMEVSVPEFIKPLLSKYKGRGSHVFRFADSYSNPANFNQNINRGLHDVADNLGIQRFDYYSARHTWASIARNVLGIDKYTIHEALNHVSQLDITDLYIQKDFSLINKANAKVVDYIIGLLQSEKE